MDSERPKWKQDEMFPLEEYPTGEGVAKYQARRGPETLTPDEVKTIRRLVKLKQDVGALARGYGISSKACREVADMLERADVPSDFETPYQARLRQMKHEDNELRKTRAAEARERNRVETK